MDNMYQYQFTTKAYREMQEILSYIRDTLQNPAAATRLRKRITEKIDLICNFPYAYPDCRIYAYDDTCYRHVVLGNYVLIFHITEEIHRIEIARFVYGKTDMRKEQLTKE